MLMFGWDFEVDAWFGFWRWNLINICVRICDTNLVRRTLTCFAFCNSIISNLDIVDEMWLSWRIKSFRNRKRTEKEEDIWRRWNIVSGKELGRRRIKNAKLRQDFLIKVRHKTAQNEWSFGQLTQKLNMLARAGLRWLEKKPCLLGARSRPGNRT